jgi:hypothetical protein
LQKKQMQHIICNGNPCLKCIQISAGWRSNIKVDLGFGWKMPRVLVMPTNGKLKVLLQHLENDLCAIYIVRFEPTFKTR